LGVDSRPSDEMLLLGVAGGRGRQRGGGRGGRLRWPRAPVGAHRGPPDTGG